MTKINRLVKFFGVPCAYAAMVQTSSVVLAQEAAVRGSSQAGVSATGAFAGGSDAMQQPFELGVFGGVLFPPPEHPLRRPEVPEQSFGAVVPEFGARLGVYPLKYVGIEAEGTISPAETDDGEGATLYFLRAHALGQLPTKVVTPFVVLGTGRLYSDSKSLGVDNDRSFHFGIGLKASLSDHIGLRFDVRDNLTAKQFAASQPNWPEILLAVSFGFGAAKPVPPPPPAPKDTDGDGLLDDQDQCPTVASEAPNGCPYGDADGDGISDELDECPKVAGIAPTGCPDPDPDKDGVKGDADACPQEAGTRPDGCPDLDPDQDGVPLPSDQCPDEKETVNGYQDADGCPDVVPEKVKRFSGVIDGIEFGINKSDVQPKSYPLLDQAVAVLVEFEDVKLLISGHTDSKGSRELNTKLSLARAESVKTYLVGKGIDGSRLTTRGAGPDEPRASNDDAAGRQKNRRIEFAIIK